jgi:aspartate/methionine/tyrosine aminotransferase
LNPETEITIGVGASETLFCVMNTFINPLDEVILITPSFDIYTG